MNWKKLKAAESMLQAIAINSWEICQPASPRIIPTTCGIVIFLNSDTTELMLFFFILFVDETNPNFQRYGTGMGIRCLFLSSNLNSLFWGETLKT